MDFPCYPKYRNELIKSEIAKWKGTIIWRWVQRVIVILLFIKINY